MAELHDPQGRFRPWPVRSITPGTVSLVDQAIKAAGPSYDSVASSVVRAIGHESLPRQAQAIGLGCWHTFGRRSYFLAPLLAEAFARTSLERVPSEVMRSPHPALWLEVPLALYDDLPPFLGCFLIEKKMSCQAAIIRNAGPSDDRPSMTAAAEYFPPGTRFMAAIAVGRDRELFATDLYLTHENVKESIDFTTQRIRDRQGRDGRPIEEKGQDERAYRLWSLLANFMLYLDSPRADAERIVPPGLEREPHSAKAREIQERIRTREGEVHAIGFRLSRVLREPDGRTRVVGASEGRRSPTGHWVEGFFRNQPYGPGQSLRKYLYIFPYWRGDDGREERIEQQGE